MADTVSRQNGAASNEENGNGGPYGPDPGSRKPGGLRGVLRALLGRNGDSNLRETFEELIEEHDDRETPIDADERMLIHNILNIGEMTARDVMIPRADIAAIEIDMPLEKLVRHIVLKPHSRYPVYRENLDDTIGMVHIKDVLSATTEPEEKFSLPKIIRKVLFVSPSMRVLDLLLQMQQTRLHMALVVDEYGGIDGLVTIEDLVEEIVGEIEDEHDIDSGPRVERVGDALWAADARFPLDELEEQFGEFLTEEEREEDVDTLGGLVFTLAGRVPARGELILHKESGIEFEVIEADPRRIKRLRLRNMPASRIDDNG